MSLASIAHWAHRTPDKVAWIHDHTPLSYGAYARRIDQVRRFLEGRLPRGATVIVLAERLYNSWLLDHAARLNGLSVAPTSAMAIAHALELRAAAVVIAEDEAAGLAGADQASIAPLLIVPANILRGPLDPTAAAGYDVPADVGAHLMHSSGTTGGFKKLCADEAGEPARNAAQVRSYGFTDQSVFNQLNFGLWTAVGFKVSSAAWSVGATVVTDQTPARARNACDHGVDRITLIPEHVRDIVAARPADAPPAPHLRIRVAGGFTPIELAQAAATRLSPWLVTGYSATEFCAPVTETRFGGLDDLFWTEPCPGRILETIDADGVPTGVDEAGELRVRLTDDDFQGYFGDPAASAERFRDGWFHPGDMAVRRADGRVRILGRIDDMLNVKGQKLAVGPIEENIRQGLGVDEVCLLLGQTRDGTEELVIAVRTTRPLENDDVQRRIRPSAIFPRVRVEVLRAFPRTSAGAAKTDRRALRRALFPD